jgi:hypothetical protein
MRLLVLIFQVLKLIAPAMKSAFEEIDGGGKPLLTRHGDVCLRKVGIERV